MSAVSNLMWSNDPEPWGVVYVGGLDGNFWQNRWHVNRERGEGQNIAVFEFEEHAEAFVAACGPKTTRKVTVTWAREAMVDALDDLLAMRDQGRQPRELSVMAAIDALRCVLKDDDA